jgi:Protein of unknown function (DUF3016)
VAAVHRRGLLGGCRPGIDAVRLAHRGDVRAARARFTDARDGLLGSPRGTANLLAEIDRYLHTAGERYVPAGLTLDVWITNIDLAGEFEPWRDPQFDRVRVMRDIYPPRFTLEFRLTDAGGAIVKEGRRVLLEQLYMSTAALNDGEPLYYDKLLLGDWLRREFATSAQATK